MDRNEEVIKLCPHFYTIINLEYYSDDIISERLIEVYEKYIFNTDISVIENVNKIKKLDGVLYKYITDYSFRSQIKSDIVNVHVQRGENVLEVIVSAIIRFFDIYEKTKAKKIQVTRWI